MRYQPSHMIKVLNIIILLQGIMGTKAPSYDSSIHTTEDVKDGDCRLITDLLTSQSYNLLMQYSENVCRWWEPAQVNNHDSRLIHKNNSPIFL